jgi:hypothetical protein
LAAAKQKKFAGYVQTCVKHVPLNVVNIHTVSIARNVLKHVKNVLKNAGKWPPDKFRKQVYACFLF